MIMRKPLFLVALALTLLSVTLFSGPAAAITTYTWNLSTNGLWNTSNNWNPQNVPNSAKDAAVINNGTSAVTLKSNAVVVNSLTLASGNTLTIQGTNLQFKKSGTITPVLTNNGTINVGDSAAASNTYLDYNKANGANPMLITGSGSIVLDGAAEIRSSSNVSIINDTYHTIKGQGAITAPMINKGTVKATTGTLKVTGAFTNSGGTIGAEGTGIFDNETGSTLTSTNVVLSGGTLDSLGATKYNYTGTNLSGWGTIQRPFDNNGGSITASGGTLKFGSTATLSNAGVLNLPTGGTFENATTGTLTIPTINLTGGTLSGNQGFSSPATSGYGTIAASLLNTGSLTATGSGQTLTVSGATSGSTGDVNAGATSTDTAKLDLQNDLSAHNFTLNQAASVNVAPGKTINLTGNFYNNSQTGANWGPAGGFNLSMGTGTFELAGRDYGAVLAGFSDNFNLANLNVTGTLTLVDEINNGNRGGAHSGAEALYISSLSGDGTLDVNGFWCYVLVDNTPILLLNGTYGGVTIIGDPPPSSPVPVPASALLLGSGLLALGLLRFGRR